MAATDGQAPDNSGPQQVAQDPWSQEKQVTSEGNALQLAASHYYNTGFIPTATGGVLYKDSPNVPLAPPDQDSRSWWRRHKRAVIITASVALVCIIVGAVVGGVVGSKRSSGNSVDGSSNTPDTNSFNNTNNPPPTVNQNLIRPNSRLPVAGFRIGAPGKDRFNIRLFYQGQDNLVRYSSFSSQFNWSKPTVVGLDTIPGTPLAACENIHFEPVISQISQTHQIPIV